MADLDLCFTPATELARRIRERELSPLEAVGNSLARIEEVNPRLNCFCFVFPEEALELARAAEQAVADGEEVGPLHGVPIAFKDITSIEGKRTTTSSYAPVTSLTPEQPARTTKALKFPASSAMVMPQVTSSRG